MVTSVWLMSSECNMGDAGVSLDGVYSTLELAKAELPAMAKPRVEGDCESERHGKYFTYEVLGKEGCSWYYTIQEWFLDK